MECPNMLSGSQLVAKGATKKIDGQLPEVGLKDVSPNGSWLEQKQIQSALEARKHLIAVERIEKSGSLSHAEWRDDLKLAEVTKQTGGHWQYYGHKRGKYLYLLPEETLFLMETNCLLLRHNDVTVSLQKAYPLCLTSMSITQYKVYASLSRLGYRVFQHKCIQSKKNEAKVETTADDVDTIQNSQIVQSPTMSLEYPGSDSNNVVNVDYSDIKKDKNMAMTENEPPDSEIVKSNVQNKDPIENTTVNNTNEDTVMNENSVTTIDTNIDKVKDNIVKDTAVNDDRDFVIVAPKLSLRNDTNINCTDDTSTRANVDTTDTNIDLSEPRIEVNNSQDENIEVSVEDDTSRMNIDDNANEMTVTNNNEDSTMFSRQDTTENSVAVSETINAVSLASVYSVDESGIVRVFKEGAPMETEPVEQNIESTTADITACSGGTKDVSTNDAFSHHQAGLKYYNDKITKLTERKSRQRSITDSLTAMQDFYKAQTVTVNIPDEIYLPRNIFLHRTEYRLNLQVVSTQNMSTLREETNSTDSSTTIFQENRSRRLTDLPNSNFHQQQNMPRFNMYRYTRYPTSHHRPYNPRPNFMYRNVPNFYGIPRYYPHYVRQQFMVYNVNVPRATRPDRQEQIKKYHFDMIVNIAMRLRNGLALPSQTQALHTLINTYNNRYKTHIRMDQNFNIIGTPDSASVQTIELDDDRVITVDEEPVHSTRNEPKRKKRRLNDSSTKYNSNLQKLKEMAIKLKELHAKDLAVSRHRRVFSNALKTFNKWFNADVRLGENFEIIDKTAVSVDTSSDSDAVVVEEKPKKRKKLRNPFSILKGIAKDVNIGASTSQVPVLRMLSLNVINQNNDSTTEDNTPSIQEALKSFYDARFTGDDFAGARVCSRFEAQLDALAVHAEYVQDILKEYDSTYNNWAEIKLAILKDSRQSLEMEKRQVEALSNDFFTTESQLRPLLGPVWSDLKSALEQLAIIPTNRDVPDDTSLKIHFDVCNRDVHFKKSNPPKPSFRVVCYDESEPFPSPTAVVALQARCSDGVPTVFAFVGDTASISYLQITPTDLPVFIPNNDVM